YTSPSVYKDVSRIIDGSASHKSRQELHQWMSTFIHEYDYCSMYLFDVHGKMALQTTEFIDFSAIPRDADFQRAIQSGEMVFSDMLVDEWSVGQKGHRVHLRIWVPVVSDGTVHAIWLLQIDPGSYLFPLIQDWPTPSKTAETLLVRKDEDRVTFLNELRHMNNATLDYNLPIAQNTSLPAARAVLGYLGALEGVDYKGIPVLAVTTDIQINSWKLVSKIDLAEVYAPLKRRGWLTGSILLGLIFASSLIIGLLLKRRGDIEELKTAKQWQATFDSVHDIIWLLDKDFTIQRANLATINLFGHDPESVLGRKCWEIAHRSSEPISECPFYRVHETRTRVTTEYRIADNWYRITLDPIFDSQNNIIGAVHTLTDVQKEKEAEAAILAVNEVLEIRVRERTAQLEAANKELEAFSYSVSHDLRAPLRAIDGWSMVLLEDFEKSLDNSALTHLARIRNETHRMGHLIDTLIQLSKMTRIDMNTQLLSLSEMVHENLQRLESETKGRDIRFVISPELMCKADKVLMDIVLGNLLSNAVKFTSKTQETVIEFGQTDTDYGKAFYIRDNGVGFDEKYSSKLFGTFQRLHSSTDFSGTGIGLAMVKRIINRHGGSVWAESQPEKQTTFYFTLGEE
ncbi:MAG: ATP-binding protein, partial [Candidatus Cloacimonadaceae bacterium]|nr:ATP-binding protein [Candidatus Cloacimonadaceae bacterium]